MAESQAIHDLLVVGAGPTGIAIGAEGRRAGLDVLVMDSGPLAASIQGFPVDMTFFTTRDLLEIADVPFAIADDKPTRRQALAYYRAVAAKYELPLALFETVISVRKDGDCFAVDTSSKAGPRCRRARALALATGYFHRPRRLGVDGEDRDWVHHRYREPYLHFRQHVAVVGGGNSAVEAALDLWRNHVRVTLVHRGAAVKDTVKYWLKPDIENRIAAGEIAAVLDASVRRFTDTGIELERHGGDRQHLDVDAAYVLVGYEADAPLLRSCGIEVDDTTLEPTFDADTCESNVPGLYVAGTLQAGSDLGRIFIENSRQHASRIVAHLLACRRAQG